MVLFDWLCGHVKQHPGIVVKLWLIRRIVWKPSGVDVSLFQKCVDCIKAPRTVRLLAGARQRQVNTKSSAWMPLHNAASRPSTSTAPGALHRPILHTFRFLVSPGSRVLFDNTPFSVYLFFRPTTQLLSTFTFPRQTRYSTTSTTSSLLIRYLPFTQYTFTASRVASCRSARNISSS